MAGNLLQNLMHEFSAEIIFFYMHKFYINDILNHFKGKLLCACNNFKMTKRMVLTAIE